MVVLRLVTIPRTPGTNCPPHSYRWCRHAPLPMHSSFGLRFPVPGRALLTLDYLPATSLALPVPLPASTVIRHLHTLLILPAYLLLLPFYSATLGSRLQHCKLPLVSCGSVRLPSGFLRLPYITLQATTPGRFFPVLHRRLYLPIPKARHALRTTLRGSPPAAYHGCPAHSTGKLPVAGC